MATGVFGAPITLDTVRATGLYPEPITQRNCSDLALDSIDAGGKNLNAANYVDNLKTNYGNGISAKCLIYNATGTTLEYFTCKDFEGHVHGSPYPQTIKNGQWGCFLHVHGGFLKGSTGAVVYRSLRPDQKDQYCDWAFSWNIPLGASSNTVYTSIREAGNFSRETTFWEKLSIGYGHWTGFAVKLGRSGSVTEDKNYGYSSKIMIAGGTTAEVRGTFQMSPP